MIKKGIFFIACLLLAACSSHTTYAPVVDGWQVAAGKRSTYVVQKGDTLYSIAWAFGFDYRDLARANGLAPPYTIHKGERLRIAAVSRPSPPPQRQRSRPQPQRKRYVAKKTVKPSKAKPVVVSRGVVKAPTGPVKRWLWPAKGKVVEKFTTKVGGNKGINIAGKYAEAVVASAAGVVVYSGSGLPSYGKLIIIKHNNSYLSAYAFNKVLLVKENSRVKAGQVIAKMGRNNAGKTLLHFEIRRNGKPINPLRYLR